MKNDQNEILASTSILSFLGTDLINWLNYLNSVLVWESVG